MKTKILFLFVLLFSLTLGIYKNLARAEEPLCGLDSVVCPGEAYSPTKPAKTPEIVKKVAKKVYTVEDTKQIIAVVAEQYKVSPKIMLEVANCESGFDLDIINHNDPYGGALGLYQIIPYFHPSVTRACAFDAWCSSIYFAEQLKAGNQRHWECYQILYE